MDTKVPHTDLYYNIGKESKVEDLNDFLIINNSRVSMVNIRSLYI
jgi:hypothetical protein